jgi:hypothetical protein
VAYLAHKISAVWLELIVLFCCVSAIWFDFVFALWLFGFLAASAADMISHTIGIGVQNWDGPEHRSVMACRKR